MTQLIRVKGHHLLALKSVKRLEEVLDYLQNEGFRLREETKGQFMEIYEMPESSPNDLNAVFCIDSVQNVREVLLIDRDDHL